MSGGMTGLGELKLADHLGALGLQPRPRLLRTNRGLWWQSFSNSFALARGAKEGELLLARRRHEIVFQNNWGLGDIQLAAGTVWTRLAQANQGD